MRALAFIFTSEEIGSLDSKSDDKAASCRFIFNFFLEEVDILSVRMTKTLLRDTLRYINKALQVFLRMGQLLYYMLGLMKVHCSPLDSFLCEGGI